MKKRVEVSYNPQLGYLKSVFTHSFDFLTGIRGYTDHGDCVEVEAATWRGGSARVILTPLTGGAFRFQMFPEGREEVFRNEVFPFEQRAAWRTEETQEELSMDTGRLRVVLKKLPWEMSVYLDGRLLTREQVRDSNVDNMCKYLPVGWDYDESGRICRVRESMYLFSDEAFYGFGERFTEFNKRGQRIVCWQQDALSTNTDISYKNHPCFMSSRGYTMLVNSFTKMTFDMGATSNVTCGVEVEDGYLDYVILGDRDPKALLADYVRLTGPIPMIPRWSLGLWMSKCVYKDQQEVMELVKRAREKKVAIDVINLDAWQNRTDGGAWVWDRERFPDPQGMIDFLKENHIHLCLWIFPYIAENSEYHRMAEEKGWLVKDEQGNALKFYPTASRDRLVSCFDFTNPEFRAWYVPRVKEVISMGVGAVKTDFSEAVPENGVYYDGSNGLQGHNKLTFLYAQTIYQAMKEVKEPLGERPMLWGRSGYAGSHTIPAAWAGDSSTHFNNHACILKGGLSLGMSGVAYWGFDMGGFYNTDHEGYECMPEDEEYIRSTQFGFFSSLSRCHGKTPREPWNYGPQAEEIFGKYNRLRHRMAPYLYSSAVQSSLESVPMMRALILEYPQDRNVRSLGGEYMLGDSLLVAPVFDQDDFAVYLPEGDWADFETGHVYKGGRWLGMKPELERIPVFVRENTMVPMLETAGTHVPEEMFTDLEVLVHLKDNMEAAYHDEGLEACLKAQFADGRVSVITGMPVKRLILCGVNEVTEAMVNGVAAQVKKDGHRYVIEIPA